MRGLRFLVSVVNGLGWRMRMLQVNKSRGRGSKYIQAAVVASIAAAASSVNSALTTL